MLLTLGDLALPRPSVSVSSKQQYGALRTLVQHNTSMGFGCCSETSKLHIGFGFGQSCHLVHELLDPGPLTFQEGAAFG